MAATPSAYERRRRARESQRQRALMGETLEQFHARENAAPPTLAEVYARNKVDRERCPFTVDLLDAPKRKPKAGKGKR